MVVGTIAWPASERDREERLCDERIMKRIEAIIRPHRLDAVLQVLAAWDATGVTVVETVGFGRQKGHSDVYSDIYKGSQQLAGLVPKRMLIFYVEEEKVEEVIARICETAQTGSNGDGKIAVSDLESVVRIRTGERGRIAL